MTVVVYDILVCVLNRKRKHDGNWEQLFVLISGIISKGEETVNCCVAKRKNNDN